MSMTLNLVDSLLTTARNLHRLGRARAAEDALLRLLRLRVLPADATAEIHSLLAEIRTDQDDYRQVRRHLSEAIANRPNCAEYHFRMALAIEADPDVQPERARASYALALSLEPGNAVYWLEYAFHLLTIEDQKAGVAALRRAYALASDDPAIVGRVAAGLRQEGLVDEARSKLLSALFSHTRDRRFRALWQQHQFELLCAKQEEQRRQRTAAAIGAPVALPLQGAGGDGRYAELGARTLRLDRPGRLGKPKGTRRQPQQRPL
jgi:tetratricopeptide (TPR) repeat protein